MARAGAQPPARRPDVKPHCRKIPCRIPTEQKSFLCLNVAARFRGLHAAPPARFLTAPAPRRLVRKTGLPLSHHVRAPSARFTGIFILRYFRPPPKTPRFRLHSHRVSALSMLIFTVGRGMHPAGFFPVSGVARRTNSRNMTRRGKFRRGEGTQTVKTVRRGRIAALYGNASHIIRGSSYGKTCGVNVGGCLAEKQDGTDGTAALRCRHARPFRHTVPVFEPRRFFPRLRRGTPGKREDTPAPQPAAFSLRHLRHVGPGSRGRGFPPRPPNFLLHCAGAAPA